MYTKLLHYLQLFLIDTFNNNNKKIVLNVELKSYTADTCRNVRRIVDPLVTIHFNLRG